MITSSFLTQIDVCGDLQKESLKLDSQTKVNKRKADIYESTLFELDKEKQLLKHKLESLERLLGSYKEQISTQEERIDAEKQYATSSWMNNSLRDQHDDDWTFREDAQKRAKIDHKMGAEAERTREGLCALGQERVMGALRDLMHASAAPAPPLPQYLASCQRLVGLVTRLRATSDEHERRELAERLLEAARLHVAPEMVVADAPATTLAQRARAQVGDLSALAIRPALMREVDEALAADGE